MELLVMVLIPNNCNSVTKVVRSTAAGADQQLMSVLVLALVASKLPNAKWCKHLTTGKPPPGKALPYLNRM
jgi:hypothetical protein